MTFVEPAPCSVARCRVSDGRAGESKAISALVRFLDRAGHQVRWVCVPDGFQDCPWTMDVVLEIDSRVWIVDHTRLTFSNANRSWMNECKEHLTAPLAVIGRSVDCRVALMCGKVSGTRAQRIATYARVCEFAKRAALQVANREVPERHWFADADGWTLQFNPADSQSLKEDRSSVVLGFPQSSHANLEQQFAAVNWPTVEKKLRGQLAPTVGGFHSRGLLLDQTYDGNGALTNTVMTPTAIAEAFRHQLVQSGLTVDGVWLLTEECEVVPVEL